MKKINISILLVILSSCNIKSNNKMQNSVNALVYNGYSALHSAIHFNKIKELNNICSKLEADLNIKAKVKELTPLGMLCEKGNHILLEEFLKYKSKIDLNCKARNDGITALGFAISKKHNKCVKLLVDNNADLERYYGSYDSPLIMACRYKNEYAFNLISKKVNIDRPGKDKVFTALYMTVINNNLKFAKKLLKLGANPNLICMGRSDYVNHSPMTIACEKNNSKALKLFTKYGGNIKAKNSKGHPCIFICAHKNSLSCLKTILSNYKNLDINDPMPGNYTPLWIVSFEGYTDIVKELMFIGNNIYRSNLDVNKADINGKTALYIALEKGNFEIANLILNHPNLEPDYKAYERFIFPLFIVKFLSMKFVRISVKKNYTK